jgi:hypothetical protein
MNDSIYTYKFLTLIIVILGVISGGILAAAHQDKSLVGGFNPTGAGTYTLQSSVSSSQNTITLTSFTEPSSHTPYTMSYLNTDIVYGTLAPSTNNNEFVSFTGITQNTNGTATLTGVVRGLSRTPGTGGCVASSTLAHAFAGQSQFILSNSPCFYSEYAVKRNNETIGGAWVYPSTTPPRLDYDPTAAQWAALSSSSLVTYHLLQTTSFSGTTNASITAKGISQLASSTQAASSTDIGTSGAEQVLMAKYATDTPQSCSGLKSGGCVVMSNLLGKISQSWLDLTQFFSFSSLFATQASSTYATTTSQLSITNGRFSANNVFYFWPNAQGSAGSTLKNDGSGNLSWGSAPRYVTIGASGISFGASTGFATSTTQQIIPANVIIASSTITIDGNVQGTASGGGSASFNIFVRDATTGQTFVSNNFAPATSAACNIAFHVLIVATSTSNQQSFMNGVDLCSGGTVFVNLNTSAFSNINMASGNTITVVLQSVNANTSNASIGQLSYLVNP